MSSPLDTATRDALLEHVEERHRTTLSNLFLSCGPRAGLTDPDAIVGAVVSKMRTRLARSWDQEEVGKLRHLLAVVEEHLQEARAFACYYVAYEQLPPDERQALKEARCAEHMARWMEEHPPSEKQIAYLRSLGYDGPLTNMREASQQIDARVKGGRR